MSVYAFMYIYYIYIYNVYISVVHEDYSYILDAKTNYTIGLWYISLVHGHYENDL